jgi:hypothetical protein
MGDDDAGEDGGKTDDDDGPSNGSSLSDDSEELDRLGAARRLAASDEREASLGHRTNEGK